MARLLRIFILISIFSIVFFQLTGFALALESEELGIASQKVNPGKFSYFFKRLYEKARGVMIFSAEGKIAYNHMLLDRRLSELDYVAENDIRKEIEKASQRFSYFAGLIVEEINKSEIEGDIKRGTLEKFNKYSEFLDRVRDRYPANTAEWLFIQQNIDTLDILSERFNK